MWRTPKTKKYYFKRIESLSKNRPGRIELGFLQSQIIGLVAILVVQDAWITLKRSPGWSFKTGRTSCSFRGFEFSDFVNTNYSTAKRFFSTKQFLTGEYS